MEKSLPGREENFIGNQADDHDHHHHTDDLIHRAEFAPVL
jgi:hypothetical protein